MTDATAEPEVSITLTEDEAAAVVDLASSYARAVPPGREGPYLALVEAAGTGTLSGDHVGTLEQVCTLALETGQARRIGLAEAETLLANVYRRTPLGKARLAEVKQINEALGQPRGKTLSAARIASNRPGRYTVTLGVDGFDLTVAIDANGIEVSSLTTN